MLGQVRMSDHTQSLCRNEDTTQPQVFWLNIKGLLSNYKEVTVVGLIIISFSWVLGGFIVAIL